MSNCYDLIQNQKMQNRSDNLHHHHHDLSDIQSYKSETQMAAFQDTSDKMVIDAVMKNKQKSTNGMSYFLDLRYIKDYSEFDTPKTHNSSRSKASTRCSRETNYFLYLEGEAEKCNTDFLRTLEAQKQGSCKTKIEEYHNFKASGRSYPFQNSTLVGDIGQSERTYNKSLQNACGFPNKDAAKRIDDKGVTIKRSSTSAGLNYRHRYSEAGTINQNCSKHGEKKLSKLIGNGNQSPLLDFDNKHQIKQSHEKVVTMKRSSTYVDFHENYNRKVTNETEKVKNKFVRSTENSFSSASQYPYKHGEGNTEKTTKCSKYGEKSLSKTDKQRNADQSIPLDFDNNHPIKGNVTTAVSIKRSSTSAGLSYQHKSSEGGRIKQECSIHGENKDYKRHEKNVSLVRITEEFEQKIRDNLQSKSASFDKKDCKVLKATETEGCYSPINIDCRPNENKYKQSSSPPKSSSLLPGIQQQYKHQSYENKAKLLGLESKNPFEKTDRKDSTLKRSSTYSGFQKSTKSFNSDLINDQKLDKAATIETTKCRKHVEKKLFTSVDTQTKSFYDPINKNKSLEGKEHKRSRLPVKDSLLFRGTEQSKHISHNQRQLTSVGCDNENPVDKRNSKAIAVQRSSTYAGLSYQHKNGDGDKITVKCSKPEDRNIPINNFTGNERKPISSPVRNQSLVCGSEQSELNNFTNFQYKKLIKKIEGIVSKKVPTIATSPDYVRFEETLNRKLSDEIVKKDEFLYSIENSLTSIISNQHKLGEGDAHNTTKRSNHDQKQRCNDPTIKVNMEDSILVENIEQSKDKNLANDQPKSLAFDYQNLIKRINASIEPNKIEHPTESSFAKYCQKELKLLINELEQKISHDKQKCTDNEVPLHKDQSFMAIDWSSIKVPPVKSRLIQTNPKSESNDDRQKLNSLSSHFGQKESSNEKRSNIPVKIESRKTAKHSVPLSSDKDPKPYFEDHNKPTCSKYLYSKRDENNSDGLKGDGHKVKLLKTGQNHSSSGCGAHKEPKQYSEDHNKPTCSKYLYEYLKQDENKSDELKGDGHKVKFLKTGQNHSSSGCGADKEPKQYFEDHNKPTCSKYLYLKQDENKSDELKGDGHKVKLLKTGQSNSTSGCGAHGTERIVIENLDSLLNDDRENFKPKCYYCRQQNFITNLKRGTLTQIEILRGFCRFQPKMRQTAVPVRGCPILPIVDIRFLYYMECYVNNVLAALNKDTPNLKIYLNQLYPPACMFVDEGFPLAEIGTDNFKISKEEMNKFYDRVHNFYEKTQYDSSELMHGSLKFCAEVVCYYMINSYHRVLLRRAMSNEHNANDTLKISNAISIMDIFFSMNCEKAESFTYAKYYRWICKTERTVSINLDGL